MDKEAKIIISILVLMFLSVLTVPIMYYFVEFDKSEYTLYVN